MSNPWFYVQNGQRLGPVPLEQLLATLGSGALPQDALVWHQDLPGWVPAHTLPELQQALRPTAPAPRPQPNFPPPPGPQPSYPAPGPYQPPAPTSYSGHQDLAGGTPGHPSPQVILLLKQTRPWARLMGVLGFIQLGFMMLAAIFGVVFGAMNRAFGPALFVSLFYLVVIGVMVPPVLNLNRYASRIRILEQTGQSVDLEAALEAQKKFWKYLGILALIGLILGVLTFAIGMIVGIGGLAFR